MKKLLIYGAMFFVLLVLILYKALSPDAIRLGNVPEKNLRDHNTMRTPRLDQLQSDNPTDPRRQFLQTYL